ncbi:MAG: hypothetical protein CL678_09820 [Bdellovibrionaceae bacterium]|nr:hypothetical protein [Pseudobdellovibrionaceae bacterium]|tara:strand:- start:4824 stop:5720 length:897 start_codon:yes stop_codon:yes gene_type:complete
MKRTKAVLIIGGSGFVGSHLARRLRNKYKVFATYYQHQIRIPEVTMLPLDVTERNWIKRVIYGIQPDVIIYAAGKNNPQWADDHSRDAEQIHTNGAASVSTVASILQPRMIYLSNSHVFDGSRGNYKEEDVILPHSPLGKMKVSGENYIRTRSLNYIILRSGPLLGIGNGIEMTLIDRLRIALSKGKKLELSPYDFQSYTSIYGIIDLIEKLIEGGPRNKVLHYGGLNKLSEYELGIEFAKYFGYDPSIILEKRYAGEENDLYYSDYSLNFTQAISTLKAQPFFLKQCFDLIKQNFVG